MADRIIIPTADAIITPVLEKLYERRPKSFPHLNLRGGTYWHPVAGFRAQAAVCLRRLAELAAARRLNTATGKDLLDYVASEFEAVPETEKTTAIGTLTLTRGAGSERPGGDYPRGTRITRAAVKVAGIEYPAAEYETLADAHVEVNSTADVVIPVQAIRPGIHANAPILVSTEEEQRQYLNAITIPPLVGNMEVKGLEVAGGSEGADDAFVRLFARTFAVGQYGPTADASKLGALSATGVRHFLVYDIPATGTQRILVADASWGSSDRWANLVQQKMYDADMIGFGCKISIGKVRNRVITVSATIVLRDANYMRETTEIDLAVQRAVRSYFDDRVDWNVWSESTLRSAIARAHNKIFRCSSVTVKDYVSGATLNEITSPDFNAEQVHFYLPSNATKLTYEGPS